MPFRFSEFCILLSRLEAIECHDPPLLPKDKSSQSNAITTAWFRSHGRTIGELDVAGSTALLSSFFPERRTDRVYGIQALGLCRSLSRVLGLSSSRARDLQAYQNPGYGDLGECLERVLQAGGPPALPVITVEEVDAMLQELAGTSRFSDSSIRHLPGSSEGRNAILTNIFMRASPSEGKWLARIILKDLSPVRIDEDSTLRSFHFLLPDLLLFQNNFGAAMSLLKGPLQEYPERPDPRSEALHRRAAAEKLVPVVGIKVGRPNFYKGRSIASCLKMVAGKRWVVERKYDGEYCEIHVDLSKPKEPGGWIKVFSKSCKDSTLDRIDLYDILANSLQLDKPECKIRRQAILLGEMVVFDDEANTISPFSKIRTHVSRSGVFIGTEQDSPPHPHEHLAIVFFDLLLLDNDVLLKQSIDTRRLRLRDIYKKARGRALGAEWKVIDFTDAKRSEKRLVEQFAVAIAQRCEGLVLKPCDVPYISLGREGRSYDRSSIKLKKDYINSMGDECDFAVIGASYDAQKALQRSMKGLKWTDFHLGCLVNKPEVQRFNSRPLYRFVGTIDHSMCIPLPILQRINALGAFTSKPYVAGTNPQSFDLHTNTKQKMEVVFDEPFVVEVLGSGFEKGSGCSYFMLRHPRMVKMHEDRSWKDCISFQELQTQAETANSAPNDSESQETLRWIERLERKSKRKTEREKTISPRTNLSTTTPSSMGNTITGKGQKFRIMASCGSTLSHCRSTGSLDDQHHSQSSVLGDDNLSTGKKRAHTFATETPCPTRKRSKTTSSSQANCGRDKPTGLRSAKCLEDITNTPNRPMIQNENHVFPSSDDCLVELTKMLLSSRKSTPQVPDPQLSASHDLCGQRRCLFAGAAVYLSLCISTTPYISEDLLLRHKVKLVTRLEHWNRDSFAHLPMTATVSESQADPNLRKIVVIEANRIQATKATIQRIMSLNNSHLRERIEVYDWRVLERCNEHRFSADMVKQYFIGATLFDQGNQRAMFVWQRNQLNRERAMAVDVPSIPGQTVPGT